MLQVRNRLHEMRHMDTQFTIQTLSVLSVHLKLQKVVQLPSTLTIMMWVNEKRNTASRLAPFNELLQRHFHISTHLL